MGRFVSAVPPRVCRWSLPAAFVALLLLGQAWCGDCGPISEWVRVKWVNDGDTVVLADDRRVRYIGINTPELGNAKKRQPTEPYATDALKFNIALVKGRKVRLEFDQEKTDRYGRLLAYCFLADGTFVNRQIIRSGFGHVWVKSPNLRYARQLLNAQRLAMRSGVGIWRRISDSGRPMVGNRRSKRFHRPSCPQAAQIHPANRIRFERIWDAYWAGFAPAKGCRP